MERDEIVLRETDRWRVVTGRQLCILAGFSSQRTCDRRLKKLIEAGYLTRKRVIYGLPGLYFLTRQARLFIHVPDKPERIRLEQVSHDIAVLNTAIYFCKMFGVSFSDIKTEKQLHQQDGFSNRRHRPDFVYTQNGKTTCVEVELSLKNKDRLEKNVQQDFANYDFSFWIVPDMKCKTAQILTQNRTVYPTMEILEIGKIEEVLKNEF